MNPSLSNNSGKYNYYLTKQYMNNEDMPLITLCNMFDTAKVREEMMGFIS